VCMSPHEMTSARIEEDLVWLKQEIENWRGKRGTARTVQIYEGRVKAMEELLKERAEDGTYATAGQY
jgi:hypothetical protein